jgi:hypothetical protein
MINLRRPDEVVRAFVALRRYGAFGGLVASTADRFGDAPAITDECGTLSFRELDQNSNALARALADKGIRPGAVNRRPSKSLELRGFRGRQWWDRRPLTPPRRRSSRRIRAGSAPAAASRG